MDPSASNFVMHQHSNSLDRQGLIYPSMPHQGPHSPCPALRAAAAEQMQAQAAPASTMSTLSSSSSSSSRGGTHYDPVHGSSSSGSWWHQNQHRHQHHHPQLVPQSNWQPPSHFMRSPYLFPQAFPGMLSPPGASMTGGPPQGQPQPGPGAHPPYHPSYNSSHAHPPAASVHTPPPFHHRPTFSSMNLIGGSAPAQHSQASGPGNSANAESHAARTPGLPALHPFATSLGPSQPSHATPSPSSSSMPPHAYSAPPDRPPYEEQAAYTADMFNYSRAPALRDWSPPRDLPVPVTINELPRLSTSTSNLRQPGPGYRHSSPEGSSDEDLESTENETAFLEVVTPGNGVMPPYVGPDERIRAHQLMRGSASGKRVASRRAIESLQSVEISGLSESERTCVICYNDFGVENPEGINEAPLRLPKCKHVFGDHCIKKWFEESDSCPYCRDKVHSEPQLRPQSIMALFRNHYASQTYTQRQVREAANAQLRSGSGSADGVRGGSFSPLAEYYDSPMGGGYMHRRPEASSLRASWQSSPGRRSPSSDLNDGRRRTRARHGSMRASPPSARSTSYATASSGGNQQFHRAYNTAQHRPVVFPSPPVDTPRFDLGLPAPFPGPPSAHHALVGASSEQARNGPAPENADVAWDPPRPQQARGPPEPPSRHDGSRQ